MRLTEGLCVQIMHKGSYDEELQSIEKMKAYLIAEGYEEDFSADRLHHEIYLSDPRRCAPERLKTVIRHPIKKVEEYGSYMIKYCDDISIDCTKSER